MPPGVYRPACVDPGKFFGVKASANAKEQQTPRYGDTNTIFTAADEGWGGMPQSQFSAIVLVNPPEDSGLFTAEAFLERDPKREVRVVGPDGEALTDVVAEGDGAESSSPRGTVSVSQLNPQRPRRFIFRHDGKKLVGFLIARGDEVQPYLVNSSRGAPSAAG